jgi:hypothetical protein
MPPQIIKKRASERERAKLWREFIMMFPVRWTIKLRGDESVLMFYA